MRRNAVYIGAMQLQEGHEWCRCRRCIGAIVVVSVVKCPTISPAVDVEGLGVVGCPRNAESGEDAASVKETVGAGPPL